MLRPLNHHGSCAFPLIGSSVAPFRQVVQVMPGPLTALGASICTATDQLLRQQGCRPQHE